MPEVQTHTPLVKPLRTRWRQAVIGLAIAVLTAGFVWQVRGPILQRVGAWWVISDELTHADAIVVLGGSIDVRPFAAADLYKRGLASKILVANVRMGRAESLGLVPSHTQLNRDVLLKLGIPAMAIVAFGESVSSTHEEAEALREWAVVSQAKRIIIPTELFAARRAQWVFDRELAPKGVHVMVYALPPPEYTLADWWHHRYGLIDFNNEGKRGKTRGGMILRFSGGRESDSFWECRRPEILTVCRTPS
jgi:uncharacterized SAM-binding protein YcdF (DUF218 family)